jgi:hypothetical protein
VIFCEVPKKQEVDFGLLAEINGFMYRYNYQRRPSALNYIIPLDKFKNIVDLLPKLRSIALLAGG